MLEIVVPAVVPVAPAAPAARATISESRLRDFFMHSSSGIGVQVNAGATGRETTQGMTDAARAVMREERRIS
ncbi:hypothetical protein GCM10008939_31730 [Deinococcus aquiradiocola]|uniref:Uncharacterized protein n=1 Tax=Deinococcus aquiradiocola TaxID=393059 RepID=A0A917PN92_9DEIO|nr:hypothetical protein GCM10008939_31730 [Deinococcus aquiradiocola]